MSTKAEWGFDSNIQLEHLYIKDAQDETHWKIPEELFDGRHSLVLRDMVYVDKKGRTHTLHKGEVIDGGTVPKLLWRVIGSPYLYYLLAYGMHDKYCKLADHMGGEEGEELRLEGDKLFVEMLEWIALNVKGVKAGGMKRFVMFVGVRIGAL